MHDALDGQMEPGPAGKQRPALLAGALSFLLIGGLSALSFVGLSTGAVALLTSLPAWLVSALCYALYVLPVYLLHRRFSFRSSVGHGRALPRYIAVQVVGVALATLLSWAAYGPLGLPPLVASMLVIGLTSGVNFVILRLWAFSDN